MPSLSTRGSGIGLLLSFRQALRLFVWFNVPLTGLSYFAFYATFELIGCYTWYIERPDHLVRDEAQHS